VGGYGGHGASNNSRTAPAFQLAAGGAMGQSGAMQGHVAGLYRYPVKGFTPERLGAAELTAGGFFPCDRIYAVEDGPSGFDPAAPAWVSKSRFTVLAKIAEVARARTRYDEATGVLEVAAAGRPPLMAPLGEESGREAFAGWLTELLGDAVNGPLKVVFAEGHRFTDHPEGFVSVVNLASVRDLESRIGRPVDPLRFRANVHVEGWPAWAENQLPGSGLTLGGARAEVFKTITRCAAPDVDPITAERDMEIVKALHDNYGHVLCGVYVRVTGAGRVAEGDPAVL
jgi:hypothetical protein